MFAGDLLGVFYKFAQIGMPFEITKRKYFILRQNRGAAVNLVVHDQLILFDSQPKFQKIIHHRQCTMYHTEMKRQAFSFTKKHRADPLQDTYKY